MTKSLTPPSPPPLLIQCQLNVWWTSSGWGEEDTNLESGFQGLSRLCFLKQRERTDEGLVKGTGRGGGYSSVVAFVASLCEDWVIGWSSAWERGRKEMRSRNWAGKQYWSLWFRARLVSPPFVLQWLGTAILLETLLHVVIKVTQTKERPFGIRIFTFSRELARCIFMLKRHGWDNS